MKVVSAYLYKLKDEKLNIEPFFSNYRVDKLKKTSNKDVYNLSLASEHLLNYALKQKSIQVDKLDIMTTKYGKPYFTNVNINFSLSHNSNYVLVVLDNANVACDIQVIDKKYLKVSKKLYLDSSNKKINDVIKDFTIKEAYLKYYGLSILSNLKAINISEKTVSNQNNQLYYETILFDNYYITTVSDETFVLKLNKVENLAT